MALTSIHRKDIPNKYLWLLIIVFVNFFGVIVYLLADPRKNENNSIGNSLEWGD